MSYVLKVTHSKIEPSENLIFEMENFPIKVQELKDIYRKIVLRPILKLNQGIYNKIVTEDQITHEYLFETEEQARNYYAVMNDVTNPLYIKLKETISRLRKNSFAKTQKNVTLQDTDGNYLEL